MTDLDRLLNAMLAEAPFSGFSPEGFAAAIDHVLTDADAAARMARAGRDLVATDLAWPVLADQLTDLVTSTAGIVL